MGGGGSIGIAGIVLFVEPGQEKRQTVSKFICLSMTLCIVVQEDIVS